MERQNLLRRFSFLLLVSLLASFNGFLAQAKVMNNEYPDGGNWKEGKKSLSIEIPITVSVEGTLLTIQSSTGRSDITVNISNDSGFSYEETIASARCIAIDLSNAPKGVYRLDLTNQWEDHLYGDIEVK